MNWLLALRTETIMLGESKEISIERRNYRPNLRTSSRARFASKVILHLHCLRSISSEDQVMLLFSLKEAVYKALVGQRIAF